MAEVLFQRIKQSRDRQHQTSPPSNISSTGRIQAQEDNTYNTSSTVPKTSVTGYNTNYQLSQSPPDGDTTSSGSGASSIPTPPGKKLPKGVVLGKDGKPCRSCTSFASWAAMTRQQTSSSSSSSSPPTSSSPTTTTTTDPPRTLPQDCPPDVDLLGSHTWTFLHSLTASYPPSPSTQHQKEMSTFLNLFSKFYPCSICAEDFQLWMTKPENRPRLNTRDDFGKWMCEAHNAVNQKLGKKEFDCNLWEERWRKGWGDGRCD